MAREIYFFDKGKLTRKHTIPDRSQQAGPFLQSDIGGYISPVGNGWIEGRSARREDLKRSGCREIDPSEYKR